jgi:hypothetical protein
MWMEGASDAFVVDLLRVFLHDVDGKIQGLRVYG